MTDFRASFSWDEIYLQLKSSVCLLVLVKKFFVINYYVPHNTTCETEYRERARDELFARHKKLNISLDRFFFDLFATSPMNIIVGSKAQWRILGIFGLHSEVPMLERRKQGCI